MSGQHVREFRDFLAKHSETFVVREDDDVIYLKKYEGCLTSRVSADTLENNGIETIQPTTPKLDPQLTNQLLTAIREHMEANPDPVPVSELFENVMPSLEAIPGPGRSLPIKRQQDLMTFLKMHSHLFRVSSGIVSLIPVPIQPNFPSPTRRSSVLEGSPQHAQQSLKQRVNSVVLKVLADNSDRDKTSPAPQYVDESAMRMSIFQRTRVILSHMESSQMLAEILRRGEAVSLDIEATKSETALVQMATMNGQAYLFDVISDPKIWVDLKEVLECNHVVKVLHDCRNVSAVLHAQHGINLRHVFDAQVPI